MQKKSIAFTLSICLALPAMTQDVQVFGFVPNIQVDGKLTNRLDYFFQTGGEIHFLERTDGQSENAAEWLTFDLAGGVSFDAGPDWNLAASLVARRRSPFSGAAGKELRPWQQATHIARFGKYRLRNRLRAEQRFVQRQDGDEFEFDLRLRYRLSLDFPLDGERLDDREFYLNTSAEWLLTPTRERAFFYHNPRGYVGLGYRFNEKNRLETGPEFRTRNAEDDGSDEHIWYWRATWVKTI
jgi:hypothetical protein